MAEDKDIHLLRRINTPVGSFVFEVDSEAMYAYVSCDHPAGDLTDDELFNMIQEIDVCHGLRQEGIETVLNLVAEGKPVVREVIAIGTPVQHGVNGRLDFAKRPVGRALSEIDEEEAQAEAAADQIDYREVNRFDNIKNGDLLATYTPAQPGVGGTDVLGRVIPASKVHEITVRVGQNVRHDEAANTFYATSHGCLHYRKGMLSVEQVYEVKKDLTLKDGNIRFIGQLDIGGDVGDGYELAAAEGMTIGGTVEASTLVSGRDLIIEGGVTGKEKGKLHAKGSVRARYLSEVNVIADGDVIVEKEIVNCRIWSLGRVIVESGVIMGGEVVALCGILAKSAGSDLGVKTLLVSGLHYKVWEQIRALDLELVMLQEEQQKNLRFLGHTFEKAAAGETIETWLRDKVDKRMEMAEEQEKKIRRLERKAGDLSDEFRDQAVPCISIVDSAYPSVTFVTGRVERETKSEIKGPLSVYPNRRRQRAELETGLLVRKIWDGKTSADALADDGADGAPVGPDGERIWTYDEIEAMYEAFDPERAHRKGGTILVAEDQTNMRMLICKSLNKAGYEAIEAKDGEEALMKISTRDIACCVIDLNMPKKNGFEVMHKVRTNGAQPDLPFIICTAKKERDDIRKAAALGAAGYMVKPFQMPELIAKVDEVVAARQAATERGEE